MLCLRMVSPELDCVMLQQSAIEKLSASSKRCTCLLRHGSRLQLGGVHVSSPAVEQRAHGAAGPVREQDTADDPVAITALPCAGV